jgi:hypothetical protein
LLVIADTVIVVRAVQWLMQVADEVEEKLQRHDLFFVISGGICQLGGELIDLVNDTVVGRTVRGHGARRDGRMIETGRIEVRSGDLDVDEVPLSRLQSRAADIGVSKLVRPRRRTGDIVRRERIRVGCEQGVDPFASVRLQKGLSDQGHDLVPVIAPRKRCAWLSDVCRERERKRSDSNHFHAKSPYGCEPRHNRRGRTTVM